MKKFLFLVTLCLLLAGCAPKTNNQPAATSGNEPNATTSGSAIGKCTPGPVDLVNYGDKGKRLANCFVEYPGEPSRQDKSYYIVEDICGQFTKEFIENILGQKIAFTKGPLVDGLYNCSYYLNDNDYVMLVLDYLSVDNQKQGQAYLGRTIKKDDAIPMDNFYAVQENGEVNSLYFILDPQKFISIERSASNVLPKDEVLRFAEKLGAQIKNYK